MTLIQPVVLYNSETWTVRKVEQIRLVVFEQKTMKNLINYLFLTLGNG